MITARLTTDELDRFLSIAAFVDRISPGIKKPVCTTNFQMLDVAPDKNTYKDSVTSIARPKIVPTSKQLSIYEFVLLLLIDVKEDQRELMYLRHFPYRSFRQLKRFYIGDSHEKIRYQYHRALVDACVQANKNLAKYL
ncbi:putative RNA polymerase sigma factor [uncultured Mediterranean phage uvMED]|nr:putative RNA polymerase sigma factor [uncultured Mediterranean phage uvMED]